MISSVTLYTEVISGGQQDGYRTQGEARLRWHRKGNPGERNYKRLQVKKNMSRPTRVQVSVKLLENNKNERWFPFD